MSEYTVIDVEMNDGECIKAALKELGYPCEVHEEAQHLHGYQGDKRVHKANIIVRRQHVGAAANDIGFLRKADGSYEMIISQYDRGATKQGNDFTQKLNQQYKYQKITREAKRRGFTIKSTTTDQNGRMKVKIMAR